MRCTFYRDQKSPHRRQALKSYGFRSMLPTMHRHMPKNFSCRIRISWSLHIPMMKTLKVIFLRGDSNKSML